MPRPKVWLSLLLLLTLLVACSTGDRTLSTDADLVSLSVDDRYIVVLNDAPSPGNAAAVRAGAASFARGLGLHPERAYGAALVGFSARMTPQRAAGLTNNPRVAYVESDDPVELFAQTIPTGIDRIFDPETKNVSIDSLGIDGVDDLRVDVDVAVIDTGVDFEHPDLNGVGGVDCTVASSGGPPWARTYSCSETAGTRGDDDHYHGTHVAGTIAALDNGIGVVGVAPGARIWAVKVLNAQGSGYESGIVAGIDWIAGHGGIEVANMSLGGSGYSQAEYDAIQNAVNNGVAFAVAAGNDNDDANNYSPAAFDNVLTVSALADFDGRVGGLGSPTCRTDVDDTLADFSNWGAAVDIAAPGVCILSTYPIEQGAYGTISGTSMASPHVAGALALLSSSTSAASAGDVYGLYADVKNAGNDNWTDDSADGILEPLLDVSTFAATLIDGTTNTAPVVSISSPTDGSSFDSGTSISFAGSAEDTEDGVLTPSLVWKSDVDGDIDMGGTFSAVLSDGTHVVTATVTDSNGEAGSATVTVTVKGDTSTGGIPLNVTAYKTKGTQTADLTWSGATSTNVDVYRNGDLVPTDEPIANDGFYIDSTGQNGGGSATYQVCEAGTPTCSAIVTATW